MRQKNFDCCSISSKTHGLKQQKIEKIGINQITAEEILRRISDDIGRGHKEGDLSVQKKFGDNVVFIGEYITGRESTMPRALVIKLTKKIDGVILAICSSWSFVKILGLF